MKRARRRKHSRHASPLENPPTASFRDCISFSAFWSPEQLGPQLSWLEHAPFAFWLIEALQPRTFVELGTHGGFSYFAFCQAIQRLQLTTQCYAIDTWQGDKHAGFYGEEVFDKVSAHNSRYSGFSSLIRATFDDAVKQFGDGTVDLLHVDGRHFYRDVKHDFETWRSKLSDRGVVIFHDINVHEHGFGVFKLWEKLRLAHPYFEFSHGHGLGVLGIGHKLPDAVRNLFAATGSADATSQIRSAYSRLGVANSLEMRLQQQAAELELWKTKVTALNQEIAARSADADRHNNEAVRL